MAVKDLHLGAARFQGSSSNLYAQNNTLSVEGGTLEGTRLVGVKIASPKEGEIANAHVSGNLVKLGGNVILKGKDVRVMALMAHNPKTSGEITLENNRVEVDFNDLSLGKGNNTTLDIFLAHIPEKQDEGAVSINAKNNNITLKGLIDKSLTVNVDGINWASKVPSEDVQIDSTNNSLNLVDASGTIAKVNNMERVNVTLTKQQKADDSGVTITNSDFAKKGTVVTGRLDFDLKAGDQASLLKVNDYTDLKMEVTSGFFRYEPTTDENGFITVTGERKKAQNNTANFSSTVAGASLLLDQGTDLLLDSKDVGQGAFVVFGGGSSTGKSDQGDLEVDGVNLLAGISGAWGLGSGTMTTAAFVEYGDGSYDSDVETKAEGDLSYFGTGLLTRYECGYGGFGEMSLRFGRTDSEMNANVGNIKGITDDKLSGSYFAGHIGLGHKFDLGMVKAPPTFSTASRKFRVIP